MNSINIEIFWVSLLGFWLSYSLATFGLCCTRLHWFVKFVAIAGLAGVLMFIEAPDLMLIVLTQCLTIFWMLAAGRIWSAHREIRSQLKVDQPTSCLRQIGLLNALLGVTALFILLTAVQVDLLEPDDFGFFDHIPLIYCVSFGGSLGVVSVLALWLANFKRWWIGAIFTIACVAGAVAIPKIIFRPPSDDFAAAWMWAMTALHRFVIWSELSDFAISVLVANAIAIFFIVAIWRFSRSSTVWIKRAAQTVGMLQIAMVIALTVGTVHLYSSLLNGPSVVCPVHQCDQINGYDELIAAGKRFDKSKILIAPEIAATRVGRPLKQELQNYSNEFEQAERALQRPLLTSAISNIDEYNSISVNVKAFRRTALAFQCRAIQHLHEGHADSAMADACLVSELSEPLRRGGAISAEFLANPIERMGHVQALRCIQAASSNSIRLAMSRLAAIEPANQHCKDLYKNDFALEWTYSHWHERLKLLIQHEESKQHYESFLPNLAHFFCANRRQVVTLMAIELFRRKEQRYPADLKSLVPTFLNSVPIDPFSSSPAGTPLVYRLSEDGSSFELYSVGANLVDDNGKLCQDGCAWEKGDVNLVASIKYEEATDAERQELTIPDP